jgi:hypothetical protein
MVRTGERQSVAHENLFSGKDVIGVFRNIYKVYGIAWRCIPHKEIEGESCRRPRVLN